MLTLPLALTTLLSALPVSEVEDIPRVQSAFPAVDTTVPANGRIVLFGGAFDAVLVLVRQDGTFRELREERFPIDGAHSALVVDLASEDLVAGETIRLEDRCDSGCEFVGTWTVEAADDEPPVFDDGPASVDVTPLRNAFGVTHSYRVHARLPGARDARSAVLGAWTSDEDGVTLMSNGAAVDGAPIDLFASLFGAERRTVCFDVRAIDASGNEAALDDELCADLNDDDGGGCAQTDASSTSVVAAFALALGLALAHSRHVRRGQAPALRPGQSSSR